MHDIILTSSSIPLSVRWVVLHPCLDFWMTLWIFNLIPFPCFKSLFVAYLIYYYFFSSKIAGSVSKHSCCAYNPTSHWSARASRICKVPVFWLLLRLKLFVIYSSPYCTKSREKCPYLMPLLTDQLCQHKNGAENWWSVRILYATVVIYQLSAYIFRN